MESSSVSRRFDLCPVWVIAAPSSCISPTPLWRHLETFQPKLWQDVSLLPLASVQSCSRWHWRPSERWKLAHPLDAQQLFDIFSHIAANMAWMSAGELNIKLTQDFNRSSVCSTQWCCRFLKSWWTYLFPGLSVDYCDICTRIELHPNFGLTKADFRVPSFSLEIDWTSGATRSSIFLILGCVVGPSPPACTLLVSQALITIWF